MSTKDNNPGLLSKVAKFVRNPTTNWSDLDKQDPEPETGYSKQALKEMIERKRQNDFVRKREFDQLRKLRNRDPSAGNPELAGRPSYFNSSMPSNQNERAMTIKKIDEIEAQMSNQWWQGKDQGVKAPGADAAAAPGAGQPAPSPASGESKQPPGAAEDMGYAATRLSPMMRESRPVAPGDFVPTQFNSGFGQGAVAPAPVPRPVPERRTTHDPVARAQDPVGSGGPESFAAPLGNVTNDPDLEEAAIRFANGDNGGAEAGLLAALKGTDIRRDQAEAWTAALFDLFRATGQQARFDSVAIEYAERFGRSAPAWFSMPEVLGLNSSTALARTLPSRLMDEPIWRSPPKFGSAAANDLQLALANAAPPWFLDWSAIEVIAPDAVEPLGKLFAEWSSTAVELRFTGVEELERALRICTPSGDKSIEPSQWRMRMDALRIMQMQDEFDLVALDYCVTYEVSPPSWQDARCHFIRETAPPQSAQSGDSTMSAAGELPTDPATGDNRNQTVTTGFESGPATVVELSGEILGEATAALARLEEARQGADRLVVSCANLIRVDFSAAGGILNWVATRQAEGCHLQFRDVHRLVAAFFNVIGINEHARIVLRTT